MVLLEKLRPKGVIRKKFMNIKFNKIFMFMEIRAFLKKRGVNECVILN